MMLQRWMITLVISAVSCVLFSGCQKKDYSPDEPLPTVYTPSVFISSQNEYLYALNPTSGAEKWEFKLNGNTVATPIVIGTYLFVATTDTLFKLDVNTGAILMRYNRDGYTGFVSSPVTDGKTLFIACNPAENVSKVIAINPVTDNEIWKVDYTTNISPSLGIYKDRLYVAQDDGKVNCILTASGSAFWPTPGSVTLGVDPLFSSPVVSPPYVYIGSTDGKLYALNLATGATSWTFDATNKIISSPIVYGGNVIFGCNDNYLYCVDSVAKDIRWKYRTEDRIGSSPAAYRNTVFVGGYDNYVYALNILDGNLKWKYQAKAMIKASVLNVEGDIYAACFDKQLYKLDTAGNLKWIHNINGPIESSPILYDYNNKKTYYPSITGMYQY